MTGTTPRLRRTSTAGRRRPRKRPAQRRRWWPAPRYRSMTGRRRWWRRFRRLPGGLQLWIGALAACMLAVAVNGLYQVVRKPSELFFPVSGSLHKTPTQTWHTYAPLFRKHATSLIPAELLAAIAQVEGSGNPVARTYWRVAPSRNPFDIYRPASSAVGMYQITDGTFAEARRYCIHRHQVVADGPWHDIRSCWFNSLYTRVVPSHAVELTAAYLDVQVRRILARHHITTTTARQRQDLAALIHLCGAGAASAYAARGLRLLPEQRCGHHDPRRYLARVQDMQRRFEQMNQEG